MKDTKAAILNAARTLFNGAGYNSVSVGDIAQAVGISKGNLTYHFQKKEDIIEALVQQIYGDYAPPPVPRTPADLNDLFIDSRRKSAQNAFYFWHYTQLSQLSPTIRAIQQNISQKMQGVFRSGFANLAAAGFFRQEAYPGEFENLVRAVQIVCVYWDSRLQVDTALARPGSFFACVWGMLLPLLTPLGSAAHKALPPAE